MRRRSTRSPPATPRLRSSSTRRRSPPCARCASPASSCRRSRRISIRSWPRASSSSRWGRRGYEGVMSERFVSAEAEQWIGKKIPCLDRGFVYLVDYMGGDASIVQAARVSYGLGTKSVSEDRGLIRYLMRHQHSTPFEMVEMKFHVKLPIFVARQFIRHRTANVNEYSGRYSVMPDEFYVPDVAEVTVQSAANRQGGGEALDPARARAVLDLIQREQRLVREGYEQMLALDIRRELARLNLGVAQYTEWYWKNDLHNIFHFLALRLDPHAQ